MAYGVLFGSRLLPQAAQRFARRAAPTATSGVLQRVPAAGLPVLQRAFGSGPPSLRAAALLRDLRQGGQVGLKQSAGSVRSYGNRSVWNVQRGRVNLFLWGVVATIAAGVMQEVMGPYVFFHE